MKLFFLPPSFLLLLEFVAPSCSRNIPFERSAPAKISSKFKALHTLVATGASDDLPNIMNIRYTTNITINGVEVRLALDTGSSDLWVAPPGGIGKYNATSLSLFLSYGDGSYGVNGSIGVASFKYGPYKIEKQAFLDADTVTIGGMQELGIYGIFGLGFDLTGGSEINDAIKKTYGPGASWGHSVLQNIFRQHPEQPNFIAMDLSRTDDLEETAGGSFTIREYDDDYKAVANTSKLPQYPPHSNRWTTLLDGIYVEDKIINIKSSIKGVPKGKAVALLDSGTPTGYIPSAVVDQIYQAIPGAVKYNFTGALAHQFQVGSGLNWIVPCNATTMVKFVFGGQILPIHPLDLSEISPNPILVMGHKYTVCAGVIGTNNDKNPNAPFEILLGDSILRNMYSVYDFGDYNSDGSTGEPYMQVLSKTVNITKVLQNTIKSRAQTLSTKTAPELTPDQLVSLMEADTENFGYARATTDNFGPSVDDVDDSSLWSRYIPPIIGLLTGNFLIGMILVILGVLNCRRGASWRHGEGQKYARPG